MPRGVYHYDPLGHRLEPLDADQADVDELLEASRVAANLSALPDRAGETSRRINHESDE